jgi:hypothetical protein
MIGFRVNDKISRMSRSSFAPGQLLARSPFLVRQSSSDRALISRQLAGKPRLFSEGGSAAVAQPLLPGGNCFRWYTTQTAGQSEL